MSAVANDSQQNLSKMAILSLVIGVLALIGMIVWTVVGMAIATVGIIFGVVSVGLIRKQQLYGLGIAKVGLFCSVVALVVPLGAVIFILFM
ncbi:putative membrane protein [Alkalibacillus flavidus]|uniref:Membrane protein n=1 Tax=Alkalibacillus flavidus TaxID=546021 RepID=A0ABV2KWZ4_9BACI